MTKEANYPAANGGFISRSKQFSWDKIKNTLRSPFVYSLAIMYIALIMDVTYSWFSVEHYRWFPLLVVIPELISDGIHFLKTRRINNQLKDTIELFLLPIVIPTVISVITTTLEYGDEKAVKSSIKNAIYMILIILLGYYFVRLFGKKLIPMILIAGTVSYATVFIRFLLAGGTNPFEFADRIPEGLEGQIYGISMEVHELTYVYGILLVFYFLYDELSPAARFAASAVCLLGIFFGDKRALVLALVAALAVYYFINRILKSGHNGIKFVCFFGISVAMFWIIIIDEGILEMLFNLVGIDDMSRFVMWNLFSDDYSFSPLYLGRGLTYTDIILEEKTYSHLHFMFSTTLHNDILRTYIGWGFIPFFGFVYSLIYLKSKKIIEQKKTEEAWIFTTIVLVYYIINFGGNTFFRYAMCLTVYVLWYSLNYGLYSNKRLPAKSDYDIVVPFSAPYVAPYTSCVY